MKETKRKETKRKENKKKKQREEENVRCANVGCEDVMRRCSDFLEKPFAQTLQGKGSGGKVLKAVHDHAV